MSTPNPTLGQALLALIENDALLSFGPPLITFLTAVGAAQSDPVKLAAAFIQLEGDIVGHAPAALGGLEAQLAGTLAAKLAAEVAKAQAALKPAGT